MNDSVVYDIVVIGGGICGAIVADSLAEGRGVLVLEAGESGPDRAALVGAYSRATRKTPGAPYLGRAGDRLAPTQESDSAYYKYVNPDHDVFKSTYVRRAGGSTWHFLGNMPRFVPNDFLLCSRYGVGVDWPITYDDLEEDYGRAEHSIGVAGDAAEWQDVLGAHRSVPFPMEAIWESYGDRVVARALNQSVIDGVQVTVRKTPQARNSKPYQGRPPCAGNSICVPICPIQAKYDATVHLRQAQKKGVELRPEAVVTEVEVDPVNAHITAVRYRDWTGRDHIVRSRFVVLAAHAIESAKILLMSGGASGRVANSSGQVGRNLMDHPQGAAGVLLNEPIFPFRGPPTTSGVDAFRDGEFRRTHGAFRLSLGNDGWGRLETPVKTVERLMARRLFGAELRRQVADVITRQFRLSFSTEMLPNPDNAVALSAETDALGVPNPKIQFRLDEYTERAFARANDVMDALFGALGIPPSGVTRPAAELPLMKTFSGAGHVIGSFRVLRGSQAIRVTREAACAGRSREWAACSAAG